MTGVSHGLTPRRQAGLRGPAPVWAGRGGAPLPPSGGCGSPFGHCSPEQCLLYLCPGGACWHWMGGSDLWSTGELRTGAELAPPPAEPPAEGHGAPPAEPFTACPGPEQFVQSSRRGSSTVKTPRQKQTPGPPARWDLLALPRAVSAHGPRDRPALSAAFHMAHKATHSHAPLAQIPKDPAGLGGPFCLSEVFLSHPFVQWHEQNELKATRPCLAHVLRRLCGFMMAGPGPLPGWALLLPPARQPVPSGVACPDLGGARPVGLDHR